MIPSLDPSRGGGTGAVSPTALPTPGAFLPEKCQKMFVKILNSQLGVIPPHSHTGYRTRPPKEPSEWDGTPVTLDEDEVGKKDQGERNVG